ncbi:MAG: NUDIX domain-containing protein [Candidatus Staskawiczbacteria bacterium]|nr:NUDIX domain-containing protein [Candidatus Staskawiczbacteria bacterium]
MIKRVYTQTYGVVGALVEKDGKFLLVKEAGDKLADAGKWNHPAGWLNIGENPVDGAKREVEEETGYKFMPSDILGIYSIARKDLLKAQQEVRHPIKIIYIGKISEEQALLKEEIIEIRWFSVEEIEAMDSNYLRYSDIKIMVKDYFAGKKYPLELLTHTTQE